MHVQPMTLPDEARTLLTVLGLAWQATADVVAFEYRAIPGAAIGWLLHPGLAEGTCAVSSESLLALCDAGYIACDGDLAAAAAVRFFLTELGETYCSLLLVDTISHVTGGGDSRGDKG